MGIYVNSGHTLTKDGVLFHSGSEIKGEMLESLKKSKNLDSFISRGVLVSREPKLDPIVDREVGSKKVKKVTVPTKAPAKATQEAPASSDS